MRKLRPIKKKKLSKIENKILKLENKTARFMLKIMNISSRMLICILMKMLLRIRLIEINKRRNKKPNLLYVEEMN